MRLTLLAACAAALACRSFAIADDDRNDAVAKMVRQFVEPGQMALPIGVTPRGTLVWCVADAGALAPAPGVRRTLIVAGLDGDPTTVEELRTHRDSPVLGAKAPGRVIRAWIPIAHPDGWYESAHHDAPPRPLTFPPRGAAYNTPGEVEAAIVMRFVEWFAPDAVVEVTSNGDADLIRSRKADSSEWTQPSLARALSSKDDAVRPAPRIARIPASLLNTDPDGWDVLTRGYTRVETLQPTEPGPAAAAGVVRRQRSAEAVAAQLLDHYGSKLDSVMYQPALALVARQHYGEQLGLDAEIQSVGRVLEPYLAGERPTLDAKSGGSSFAGHLAFAAWAISSRDKRAIALVKKAADRAFDEHGRPREAMPSHNEMSDAVFMACPILTAAGRLTGEPKYLDMAGRHLEFMQKLCLRDDGLYRHSPLCETPWGRGNGFPALGLALCLSDTQAILDLPQQNKDAALRTAAERLKARTLATHRTHLASLLERQDPTGMWRQVIDHPGAYREMTATCMIAFALARGLREGWLDEATHRPALERAWEAVKLRVYEDGVLLDVCTGTGKQKTLQDYLNREAIFGRDERGGAMALLFAVEMMELVGPRKPASREP